MSNPSNDKKEVLLVSVNRGYEEDLIKGCLQTAKIPFYTKGHSGPAGFARYDTKYQEGDIEFYVPEEVLDKAKDALPPIDATEKVQKEHAEKEAAAEDVSDNKDNTKKAESTENAVADDPKSKAKRTVMTILFLILAVGVIFGIDAIMNFVRAAMGWQ